MRLSCSPVTVPKMPTRHEAEQSDSEGARTEPVSSTLTERTCPSSTCAQSEPSRSASITHGLSSGICASVRLGALTTPTTGSSANALTIDCAISCATLACASSVEAPRCGVAMTFGCLISGHSSSFGGSLSKTSSAAPATCPLSSACRSASSSMMPPRAQLTMRTLGFIDASASALIMLRVSSSSGTCTVRKSARRMASAAVTGSMLSLRAISAGKSGSKPTTVMPKDCMRETTSRPTRPSPSTPSVLPCSSTPTYFLRSHLPAFIEASACATLLASAQMREHVCSAAEMVLPPGVLITTMPRRVAAAQSMLSTPVPARPMQCIFFAASSTPAETVVAERTIIPS
mmetsp:Transcript_26064/g.50614  ORF Transcript_26064/g.50614 Transcript_26064/m.50614 type:complete len:345 (-) Transcript_26064:228-1262(-)